MKKETRDRAKRFLTSESGRVGIRAPLTLGVASGVLLLSQMMYAPPQKHHVIVMMIAGRVAGVTRNVTNTLTERV